jgi:hypothetical protein
MRTKTLLLSAVALAAGVLSSQAQSNVYSANVVGYINRSLPANPNAGAPTFALVANHLDAGNNAFTNILQSLPVNTKVLKWDPVGGNFNTYTRSAIGAGWLPTGSGTNTLSLGEAAFVQLPAGNVAGFTNTFVGTVFQSTTGPITNNLLPGFTFQSFPVPLAALVTDASVGLNAALPATPSGSKLLAWDETAQNGYTTYTRSAIGSGWLPSVPTVSPAAGFFIFNAAATNRPWVINFQVQ